MSTWLAKGRHGSYPFSRFRPSGTRERLRIVPSDFSHSPEFQRLLGGDAAEIDLARVALEIARDVYSHLEIDAYLARIEDLGRRVRGRLPAGLSPERIIAQINWVLFVEEGFRGNDVDYYDPRNSYLNEVIDRRLGIPISLAAIYQAIATRVGLPMAGVNLPCHFVLRTGPESAPLFVDPYHEGAILDRQGCRKRVEEVGGQAVVLSERDFAPCSNLVVVARMLRNLKGGYLRLGDFAAALPVQRRLASLLPGELLEQRDLGVVAIHAGRAGEAIEPLLRYLQSRPEAEDREAIQAFLKLARREVASWN